MLGYNIYCTLKDRADIRGIDLVDIKLPHSVYRRLSLFDRERVEESIAEWKPDVLVHTAALVNVDACEDEPGYARRLNTVVTAELAEICHTYGVKMVYISTDAVFDGESCRLYSEEDETGPVNVYGKTKLDGEAAVLQYDGNLVLRTNIYGINIQDKQSFGEWIYDSLKAGKTLNMFSDIDFSPILVTELAELICQMCEKNLGGLYHACGTGCINKYDFGMKLKDIFGIKTGQINRTTSDCARLRARRSIHMGMSNAKLCGALNVKISTPEESIYSFYEMMRRKHAGDNDWG